MHSKTFFRVAVLAALFGVLAVFSMTAADAASTTPTIARRQTVDTSVSVPAFPSHGVIERQVNTYTENRQEDPSLAICDDGRILVAWGSRRQEFGTSGIFAQLFDLLGRPLGTEIHGTAPGRELRSAASASK